jgi:hypothetical protein
MTEPQFKAVRHALVPAALDDPGHLTLVSPDGKVCSWPREAVSPWLSADEQDKVRWLVQVSLEIHAGEFSAIGAALADLKPTRDRLGWP